MIDAAAVIERIHERIKAADTNVKQVEIAAGHPGWIRHLQAGRTKGVKMDKLASVASVLGTTLDYLAYGAAAAAGASPVPPPSPEEQNASIAKFRATQAQSHAVRQARRLTPGSVPLTVRGEVAAGQWLQVDNADAPMFEEIDLPVDRRWPAAWQYGLLVRGTSINRVAPDGAFLLCLDAKSLGQEPRDGDLVIVERYADGGHTIERTARRYKRNGSVHELWPDSTDPRWSEPLVIDPSVEDEDTKVEMVAFVVWVHIQVQPLVSFNPRGVPGASSKGSIGVRK